MIFINGSKFNLFFFSLLNSITNSSVLALPGPLPIPVIVLSNQVISEFIASRVLDNASPLLSWAWIPIGPDQFFLIVCATSFIWYGESDPKLSAK